MEIAGIFLGFVLVFGAILAFAIRRVWKLYRVVAVSIPTGADSQAFRFKLTEAIRSLGYRADASPGPTALFHAPAWQRWAVGLQDITVEQLSTEAVLLTGPAFNISRIAPIFAGAAKAPYHGQQPVWPLAKGFSRLFAALIVVFTASLLTAYLAGVQ